MSNSVTKYEGCRSVLTKLEALIKAEAKLDPRLARGAKRITRLLALLKVAQGKYEIVLSRKVPAKLAARKAKAKVGAKKRKPAKKSGNVVRLHPEKSAA